jgi:putative transposase
LEVVGTRKVQQDGISFQGLRYQSPTLSAYVKEEVDLRYDPRDMAEVRVFYQGAFLCRAISEELAGEVVSLKEIVKARMERRRDVKEKISAREEVVQRYLEVHQAGRRMEEEKKREGVKKIIKIKRYFNE